MVKSALTLRTIRMLFASALILVITACGGKNSVSVLSITDVWARPTPSGATVAAVYLTIVSPVDDVLLSLDSPVAERASVQQTGTSMTCEFECGHQSHGGGHEVHNRPSNGSETSMPDTEIKLAAGTPVTFSPGGILIMLEGLRAPLLDGSSFTLSLRFLHAGAHHVQVRVATNPPG